MNFRSTSLATFFLLIPNGFSAPVAGRMSHHLDNVRTTAYTHSESDHVRYGRKSAAGNRLKVGPEYTSAAADWSRFPYGTRFRIKGLDLEFVIDDYGSALVGKDTIDLYHPTRSSMNRWGVRHVDIEILEFGDFEKSREILADRTKYSHVRKMLASIPDEPPAWATPTQDTPPVQAAPKPTAPIGRVASSRPVSRSAISRGPAPSTIVAKYRKRVVRPLPANHRVRSIN